MLLPVAVATATATVVGWSTFKAPGPRRGVGGAARVPVMFPILRARPHRPGGPQGISVLHGPRRAAGLPSAGRRRGPPRERGGGDAEPARWATRRDVPGLVVEAPSAG
ncbi:MAG: hypothetical protein P4L20_11960, partial [Acidimicrobiales bacterium]|nr:hypothetical protein [Acidimicrobiales bacterium]